MWKRKAWWRAGNGEICVWWRRRKRKRLGCILFATKKNYMGRDYSHTIILLEYVVVCLRKTYVYYTNVWLQIETASGVENDRKLTDDFLHRQHYVCRHYLKVRHRQYYVCRFLPASLLNQIIIWCNRRHCIMEAKAIIFFVSRCYELVSALHLLWAKRYRMIQFFPAFLKSINNMSISSVPSNIKYYLLPRIP